MPTSDGSCQGVARAVNDYLAAALSDDPAAQQMHLSGMGAISELEEKFRRYYDKKHALLCGNATNALLALGITIGIEGQEFITTPLTYGATIGPWLFLGGRAVFVDVDPHDLTLDPAAVEAAITEDTKAILAVDIHGNPHDGAALRRIADAHGLFYIADAAQSFGAWRDGAPASRSADVVVTSFTAGKTLFAGEGAAVLTDHDELHAGLVWSSQHPYRQRRELGLALQNELAPLNARIHPLAAVWANAAFESALAALNGRQQEMLALVDALNGSGLTDPIRFGATGTLPSFFRVTAGLLRSSHEQELHAALARAGHDVEVKPMPLEPLYRSAALQILAEEREAEFRVAGICAVAEDQVRRRVMVQPRRGRRC